MSSTSLVRTLAASGALALPLGAQSAAAPQGPPPVGCYRANRPLGTAGPPERQRFGARPTLGATVAFDDTTAHYFRLDSAGRITRAMLTRGARFWDRSRWTQRGDTLAIRLATGTSGWDLTLIGDHRTGRYAGLATYTSDVVVRGHVPPRVGIRVVPAPCPLVVPT